MPTVAAPAEDSANQASAAPQVTTEHSDSTVASGDHEPNTKHAGKNEFETANHNVIAKTTKDEADVMRDIRRSPRRFDPAWMIVAQGNLGVVDETGAMNTETLRATRAKAGNPKLGAQAILDDTKLLAQLASAMSLGLLNLGGG